jgi:hypothetical protein
MSKATKIHDDVDGILVPDLGELKEQGEAVYERAKEGLEEASAAVLDVLRPLNWKKIIGIAAGVAVVVAVVCVARRRPPVGLLARGLREGARLVPEQWHAARRQALGAAQDAARESMRESARLWNKIPRVRVDFS